MADLETLIALQASTLGIAKRPRISWASRAASPPFRSRTRCIGVARKTSNGEVAERVLGLAKLIGQVQHMAQKSGASDGFNAWTWFSDWVVEPLPALGGTRPFELLDTIEGQSLIAKCLNQIQTGAYA